MTRMLHEVINLIKFVQSHVQRSAFACTSMLLARFDRQKFLLVAKQGYQ